MRRIKIRCQCCNRPLSDYESTLRRADNGEFVDICLKCLEDIPITTVGRNDLEKYAGEQDDFNIEIFNEEEE